MYDYCYDYSACIALRQIAPGMLVKLYYMAGG